MDRPGVPAGPSCETVVRTGSGGDPPTPAVACGRPLASPVGLLSSILLAGRPSPGTHNVFLPDLVQVELHGTPFHPAQDIVEVELR